MYVYINDSYICIYMHVYTYINIKKKHTCTNLSILNGFIGVKFYKDNFSKMLFQDKKRKTVI